VGGERAASGVEGQTWSCHCSLSSCRNIRSVVHQDLVEIGTDCIKDPDICQGPCCRMSDVLRFGIRVLILPGLMNHRNGYLGF